MSWGFYISLIMQLDGRVVPLTEQPTTSAQNHSLAGSRHHTEHSRRLTSIEPVSTNIKVVVVMEEEEEEEEEKEKRTIKDPPAKSPLHG
jgi:hypothetical protein